MSSETRKYFDGKVVLITGASSGVGAATAIHMAKLGANLSLSARNKDKLEEIAEKCEAISSLKPIVAVGDLTVNTDIMSIIETTIKHFLTIDVLVNNAAVLELGGIEATSIDQFDRIFSVNVRAVFHLTMLAVPYLVKSKGSIINVSCVNGSRAIPGLVVYNMSKAAIEHFTRSLALDLAPKQVRVNCVSPGSVIKTELYKQPWVDKSAYNQAMQKTKDTYPLGRPSDATEVANVIAFLSSKEASYITGTTLFVDGGRSIR